MKLSYVTDRDRCYGAAGMAVAVILGQKEELLQGIDLEQEPQYILRLSDKFYYCGNPTISARTSWNEMLGHFDLAMNMVISNVMSRRMIGDGNTMSRSLYDTLLQNITTAGQEYCSLDDDETRRLYDKNFSYLSRVFEHPTVRQMVSQMADTLTKRHKLSQLEIIEMLSPLRR